MKLWKSLKISIGSRSDPKSYSQDLPQWSGQGYELDVFKSQTSLSTDSGLCTERGLRRTHIELLKPPGKRIGLKLADTNDRNDIEIQDTSQSQPEILNDPTSVPEILTSTSENITSNDGQAVPAGSSAEASETSEISLDPELLSALGASTSDTPEFGENVHESLVKIWTPLLKKGLTKEDKDRLTKEYLIPANCPLLLAPKLNAEMSAAVSDLVRGRDKKITGFQQQLGTGTAAVNKAMDTLLKSENKILALKYLSDACRIFSDLHFLFTKDRTKLITPSLDKKFTNIIQESERDDTLFGKTLSEKIKASTAIDKQGAQIRKTQIFTKPTPQSPATRSVPQGNWVGPPRYPAPRGGRGGLQKRPALPARRPYPSQFQSQSRPSNLPKTRAPHPQ